MYILINRTMFLRPENETAVDNQNSEYISKQFAECEMKSKKTKKTERS